MWNEAGYERCLAFINCHLGAAAGGRPVEGRSRPAVTISRMTGSGGRAVAATLAAYLQERVPCPWQWTVFDRDLMERVLEDHQLSKRLAEYMPENRKSLLVDTVEEFLGLHPSAWALVQHTAETILRLAEMGYVILVGRGANLVTATLENVYHVRLIGSLEKRVARVQTVAGLDRAGALEYVRQQDQGRRLYLKQHFNKNIDDPLLYHLVINTDLVGYDDAARLIGEQIIRRSSVARPNP
jgi:cytidylate kinase